MLSRGSDLIALLWPLILALVFLLIAIFPKTTLERTGVLRLSLFGFLSFEQALQRGFIRIVLLILAGLMLIYPGFRDYSRFFPETLKLTVFFDDQGIDRMLQSLSEGDLRKLLIDPDWRERKKAYFVTINHNLETAKVPFRFREIPGQTSATGEVKIRVQMIDRWGAQLYQIVDAKGSLIHTTELPGTERYQIISEFELLRTAGANINGSIADIYVNHGLLIMPEFKQLFRISPTKEVYYNSVIAATRVDVFPYINLSHTLYLLRQKNGRNVPIGYAINSLPD